MNRANVLIVDPERYTSELFARALETHRDCKCYMASDEKEAIELLASISFDLFLLDMNIMMPGNFGLLKRVRRACPDAVVVVHGYLPQKDSMSKVLHLGADGYLVKPIKIDLLRKKIDELYVRPARSSL